MDQAGKPRGTKQAVPSARERRSAANAVRSTGADLVRRAKLHLLEVMRGTERCAPWRSGRTLKDLERRSGLVGSATPVRAPLLTPLIELLIAGGLVLRRAGHYRLAGVAAARCPSCAGSTLARQPAPTPPDDAFGACDRFVCSACGAWSGLDSSPARGASSGAPRAARRPTEP